MDIFITLRRVSDNFRRGISPRKIIIRCMTAKPRSFLIGHQTSGYHRGHNANEQTSNGYMPGKT